MENVGYNDIDEQRHEIAQSIMDTLDEPSGFVSFELLAPKNSPGLFQESTVPNDQTAAFEVGTSPVAPHIEQKGELENSLVIAEGDYVIIKRGKKIKKKSLVEF
uniref:Uncharacterized protein n=1 Tax=Lygus hesperus TaxID=30085 RepID=A0A0K8SJH1_LYGHE